MIVGISMVYVKMLTMLLVGHPLSVNIPFGPNLVLYNFILVTFFKHTRGKGANH